MTTILDNTHPDHAAAMKAIGDFMGWTVLGGDDGFKTVGSAIAFMYFDELDCWHAVETRIIERGLGEKYMVQLVYATGNQYHSNPVAMTHWHATAAQRAEAAWRTIREAKQ